MAGLDSVHFDAACRCAHDREVGDRLLCPIGVHAGGRRHLRPSWVGNDVTRVLGLGQRDVRGHGGGTVGDTRDRELTGAVVPESGPTPRAGRRARVDQPGRRDAHVQPVIRRGSGGTGEVAHDVDDHMVRPRCVDVEAGCGQRHNRRRRPDLTGPIGVQDRTVRSRFAGRERGEVPGPARICGRDVDGDGDRVVSDVGVDPHRRAGARTTIVSGVDQPSRCQRNVPPGAGDTVVGRPEEARDVDDRVRRGQCVQRQPTIRAQPHELMIGDDLGTPVVHDRGARSGDTGRIRRHESVAGRIHSRDRDRGHDRTIADATVACDVDLDGRPGGHPTIEARVEQAAGFDRLE